jgi:putative copper export protein
VSFIALFQAMGTAIYRGLFASELEQTAEHIQQIGVITSLLAMLATTVQYLLEAARMSGTLSGVFDPELQHLSWESTLGTAWSMTEGGLLLLLVGFISARRSMRFIPLLGACVCIAAFMLVGHTLHHPLLQILLAVHLAVVAFWFGALWPLHLAASREPTVVGQWVVDRFSRLATRLVPGIFIAGLLLMVGIVPSAQVFLQPYGLILVGKASAFALLMALAALNRNRFGPHLNDAGAARAFRRTVLTEWVLIAIVLSATAVLTSLFGAET